MLRTQCAVQISGKNPAKVSIFIPSVCNKEQVSGKLLVTDSDGNLVNTKVNELSLLSTTPDVEVDEKISFDGANGKPSNFTINNPEKADFRIQTISGDIDGESNPSCTASHDYNIFWGEYHIHTYASDGLGTIKESFAYGRNQACLDWGSLGDHLGYARREWKIIRDDTEAANEPGKFVSLFGLKVSAEPGIADLCIITPDIDIDISNLLDAEKDKRYFAPRVTLENLYNTLEGQNCIIIPHFHMGNGTIWNYPAPPELRLIEIYSCWGNHEYKGCALPTYGGNGGNGVPEHTIHDMLKKGHRYGIVAGSDGHDGQMGKTTWLRVRGVYPGGLTAVLAENLTRESLWEALNERRTYATTGARIFLDFNINNALMGSEITIKPGENININIKAAGTCPTFITHIFKNGEIWKGFDVQSYPYPPDIGSEGIVEKSLIDENITETTWYYVRVTQADGQMAWSSPIWIDVE